MKQITAKEPIQVLEWIDTQPHHIVSTEFDQRKKPWRETHVTLANYHEKLRIPIAMWAILARQIQSNPRAFDTRMYALTRYGRRNLNNFNNPKKE